MGEIKLSEKDLKAFEMFRKNQKRQRMYNERRRVRLALAYEKLKSLGEDVSDEEIDKYLKK